MPSPHVEFIVAFGKYLFLLLELLSGSLLVFLELSSGSLLVLLELLSGSLLVQYMVMINAADKKKTTDDEPKRLSKLLQASMSYNFKKQKEILDLEEHKKISIQQLEELPCRRRHQEHLQKRRIERFR